MGVDKKEIWIPTTKTMVTVKNDGIVHIWDEIEMNLVPIKKAITGFGDKEVS